MTILSQTQSFLFKDWSCFWFILIYLTSSDFFFVLVTTENYSKQYKNRTQDCHRNENYKFFLVHVDACSFKAALIKYVGNGYYYQRYQRFVLPTLCNPVVPVGSLLDALQNDSAVKFLYKNNFMLKGLKF